MKARIFSKQEASWQEVADASESEGTVALVYKDKTGATIAVSLTIQTESGDWVLFADYYFRPDGSLAKMRERLNTFNGEASVLRDAYFGCDGKVLRRAVRHLDLKTQQPKKPSEEFIDERAPLFLRVGELPF